MYRCGSVEILRGVVQKAHHLPNQGKFLTNQILLLFLFVSHQHRGCRNFKPKYISMADELTSKYADVEVYAVSCAPHKDICNKHKIGGYPVSYLGRPRV